MISSEKLAPLLENLIESLPESYSLVDRELIIHAYKYAEKAHESQKRVSGEPYITHCVAVAIILAELQVQPVVVVAACFMIQLKILQSPWRTFAVNLVMKFAVWWMASPN